MTNEHTGALPPPARNPGPPTAALPTSPAELAEQLGVGLPPLPEAFEAEFTAPGMSPVSAYTAEQMQDYARAALAARQPGGLSPIANRKLEELTAQGYVTNGVAIFNPATGKRGLVDKLGYVGWKSAQGIDLGQLWEQAHAAMREHRKRNKHDCFVLRCLKEDVQKLIDGQRDAAPGVDRG